jgi:DNA-binding GntR family transcriptional regulator
MDGAPESAASESIDAGITAGALGLGDREGDSVSAVYDKVRKWVVSGEIKPGQEVSQVRLAKHLGVSRTPLREALRLLHKDRLIDFEPNRLVRIAELSVRDAEYVYVSRVTLEAVALRISAPLMSDAHLALLRGSLDAMAPIVARRDYDAIEVPHRRFHRQLVELSGPQMTEVLLHLSARADRYRRAYMVASHAWETGFADHAAILEACAAKDVDVAADLLVRHLARTAYTFIAVMEPNYNPAALGIAVAAATNGRQQGAP